MSFRRSSGGTELGAYVRRPRQKIWQVKSRIGEAEKDMKVLVSGIQQ